MYPFYHIWNTAILNRLPFGNGSIVVIVGLISTSMSMIFGACTATEMMTLCSRNESMPCVLRYGETKYVCPGDPASANMTLRVDANTIPQNVSILVQDYQFSKGPDVSGQFHNNGDEAINRWTNGISFQGNTMTYELWNSDIEFRDQFECDMEIDIEGKKFKSKPFEWFDVHRDNCITKPPGINDTTDQYLDNITLTDQLNNMSASINAQASELAELKKMNFQLLHLFSQLANDTEESIQRAVIEGLENVTTKLDTQNNTLDTSYKMEVAVLVLVLIISLLIIPKIFIPLRVQKGLQNKFLGLQDYIGCNNLSSSSTSDHSTLRSQSSSSLASRNQDESSPNKEAKHLLQGDTESLINLTPSDHSTVRSQSSSSLASRNQDDSSPNKEAKHLLQEETESLLNLNPSDHSTVRSQSSSILASRNQDDSSPNKEAKQLLQGDTESLINLNPSDYSTVRSQSSSSLANRNQDDSSPNKESKQLLQGDKEPLLNLNPSDELPKIPDAIQKYTNGRPSTDDEQHCKIEMTNIG